MTTITERARIARRKSAARSTLARVTATPLPPARLLPCPVCSAEVDSFSVTPDPGTGALARSRDTVRLWPCGHGFERREYPDWWATFASEGG